MSRRKSVIGIAALLALVVCAFAAANASAESKAFECSKSATSLTFPDAHCVPGGSGSVYGHKSIAEGVSTSITGSNEKTASSTTASSKAILKGTLSGLETELECSTVTGSGSMKNGATSVTGTGQITYSGCTVTKPARECKVKEGKVVTKNLEATTASQTGTNLKFKPEGAATEFAAINIEGCKNNVPPANAYPVSGSLVATTNGATTSTTETGVTGQGTLTFGGNPAGLEGTITINAQETGNALSLT